MSATPRPRGASANSRNAAVGTFVANAWENANGLIREADVKLSRAALETGKKP